MMKISIIITAYNVARWINDCICSCINQDLVLGEEYEIIVVNDGSTDNIIELLDSYKNEIVLINQVNSGVSVARNNGLQIAHGEYVWFVDGDDYIEGNVLGGLYKYVKEKDLDFLVFAFNLVPDNIVFPNSVIDQANKTTNKFTPIFQGFIDQMVACNTLARLEYIKSHNISFKERMRYGEDTLWAFFMQLFEPRQEKIYNKVYNYRERQSSAMHLKTSQSNEYWLESMYMMHEAYIEALEKYSAVIEKDKIENIKERIKWSSQNLLFGALRLGKDKRNQVLAYLKKQGNYPYSILWGRLTWKYGLNNFLVNLISLFFPFECYYLFLGYLYDRLKR